MNSLVLRKFVPFICSLDEITRSNFKIDAISSVGFGLFAGAFYPFYAITGIRLGATGMLLALITAAPFMGQIFAVYWGYKSERRRKLPFVVISGFLARVMVIIMALTHRVEVFALLIVLHFLLASAGWPAYTGLMRKIYPFQYRGKIMGRVQFLIGLIRIFATYYAGIWLDNYGHGGLFIVAGIAGIMCSLIYRKIEEPDEVFENVADNFKDIKNGKESFSLGSFLEILKNDRLLRLVLAGFFLFDLGNLMLTPVYPFVQVKYFGLTNFSIGRLAIFWILGWFITAPFWGNMIDKYNPVRVVIISIFLFAGPPLIYFFHGPYPMLMLASFFGGAAASGLEVGWLNMMIQLGGDKSSQYSGLYLTVLGIRGLLGPVLGNLILTVFNPYLVFPVTIALLAVGLIPFIIYIKNKDYVPAVLG